MANANKWYTALLNQGTASSSRQSAPSDADNFELVATVSEIKALMGEAPSYNLNVFQTLVDDASFLAREISTLPATSESYYLDSSRPEDSEVVPAVLDGISEAKRSEVLALVRPLRVKLDTILSQASVSNERFSSLSKKVIECSEKLKNGIISYASGSIPGGIQKQSTGKPTPSRVTISAVVAALAPLDVFATSSSKMAIKSFYGSQTNQMRSKGAKNNKEKKTFEQCNYAHCTRPRARHDYKHCWDRIADERKKSKLDNSGNSQGEDNPEKEN